MLCVRQSLTSLAWLYCKGDIYPHCTYKGIDSEVFLWLGSKTFCDLHLHFLDTAKKAVDTMVQDPRVHDVGIACIIQALLACGDLEDSDDVLQFLEMWTT